MEANEEMAVRGAELLLPVFEREHGKKGRLSIQTNPKFYRDAARITEQALRFGGLAPNMQVKIPATRAGVQADRGASRRPAFRSTPRSASPFPRRLPWRRRSSVGSTRREDTGEDISPMAPVCTIMIGRLDDWVQVLVKRDGILVDPGIVHWAGIACLKKAYVIFRERGYRTRLLAAAYRSHLHWTELIGGDIVVDDPVCLAAPLQRVPDRGGGSHGRTCP